MEGPHRCSRVVRTERSSDFKFVETDVPAPGAGEVLVRKLKAVQRPNSTGLDCAEAVARASGVRQLAGNG